MLQRISPSHRIREEFFCSEEPTEAGDRSVPVGEEVQCEGIEQQREPQLVEEG